MKKLLLAASVALLASGAPAQARLTAGSAVLLAGTLERAVAHPIGLICRQYGPARASGRVFVCTVGGPARWGSR